MKKLILLACCLTVLGLMLLPSQVTVSDEEDIEFVGAAKCKMCHNRASSGKFHDDWSENKHAKALDLLNDEEKKNPECLACHSTGFGKTGGFVSLEETPKLAGVQCEMCHGPGGKHIKSKKDEVIAHAWEPDAKTCEKCHNDKSPDWDPNRYEYKGEKGGFIYEAAVKKANHSAVFEALGKKPTKTGDL